MTECQDANAVSTCRLCSECIGEAYLSGEVDRIGVRDKCDYCGQQGTTITIDEVCNFVQDAFEKHYQRTRAGQSIDDWIYLKHSDRGYEREGDPADWAIAAAAEIEEEPANDVRRVLYDRHYDFELAQMAKKCRSTNRLTTKRCNRMTSSFG